ncbi:MAG: ribose-5-phosphate isomerase RpiA [Pseudomonadota bacterium]
MTAERWKGEAAERALSYVKDGMKLGLGTGSTAAQFVTMLAARVKEEGLKVLCVPTSEATRALAEQHGLTLTTLDEIPFLDLTVDGADEIDDELRLIKGAGGALLREKIVATASDRMIVIADHTKQVDTLGAAPLPIEVVPFGLRATEKMIEMLAEDSGCAGELKLRRAGDGQPFRTDGGNYIFDGAFSKIDDPEGLSDALHLVPGVVEHGLFLWVADLAVIGGPAGVQVLEADYGE